MPRANRRDKTMLPESERNIGRQARRPALKQVLNELTEMFGHMNSWVISGSIAMRRWGLTTYPDDVDLWCTESALQEFAAISNSSITSIETQYFRTNSINFVLSGWPVDVVGSVQLANGATQVVDDDMLTRAQGSPPAESAEDLIADYLAVDRHRPKDDRRLRTLINLHAHHWDWEYLQRRMRDWKVRPEAIERFVLPHLATDATDTRQNFRQQ